MLPPAPRAQETALRVRLAPSRRLAWLLGVSHAGALLLSWITAVEWWLSLVLSLAALGSLRHALRYQALRSAPGALIGLELRPDGSAAVQDQRGCWREARLLRSSFVSPWLTILNLTLAGARLRRSVLVAPDSLQAGEFRRVRVWLRWRAARGDVAASL
jgi:toxin CptA